MYSTVTSYHHNIETSRRNFPNVCTTHTYDQKIETLKVLKKIGMYDVFGESGSAAALIHKYGLDAEGVYNKVKAFI